MAYAGITFDTYDVALAHHGNVLLRSDGELAAPIGFSCCGDAAMAEDLAATINRHLARIRAERIAAE